jgi:hypothetical protein
MVENRRSILRWIKERHSVDQRWNRINQCHQFSPRQPWEKVLRGRNEVLQHVVGQIKRRIVGKSQRLSKQWLAWTNQRWLVNAWWSLSNIWWYDQQYDDWTRIH